jgi:tetratricopeptide (TPR) repeat protein
MKKLMIILMLVFLAALAWIAFRYVWISHFNRGSEHMAAEQYDQAIRCFDRAIKLNPKFAPAYCNRGTSYYEKGDFDAAVRDFTKTLQLNPNIHDAYYNRAAAYYQLKQYEKAWQDVEKARSLDYQMPPDFLEALRKAAPN